MYLLKSPNVSFHISGVKSERSAGENGKGFGEAVARWAKKTDGHRIGPLHVGRSGAKMLLETVISHKSWTCFLKKKKKKYRFMQKAEKNALQQGRKSAIIKKKGRSRRQSAVA